MSTSKTENRTTSSISILPRSMIFWLGAGLFFLLGVWATRCFYKSSDQKADESATVLLEQIRHVSKLITVEGQFSEVFTHKDYWLADVFFLQKRALIRVNATVSAGFDLSKAKIEAFSDSKTIKISNLPRPEILAIDHKLDYYDITEGTFQSFKPEDYNRMNQQAKDHIAQQAAKSSLMTEAEKEGQKALELIAFLAKNMGWTVEIEKAAPLKN